MRHNSDDKKPITEQTLQRVFSTERCPIATLTKHWQYVILSNTMVNTLIMYLLHRSKKTKHQNHITKYLHFWRLGTFNRNKNTSLMQFVFSVGGICITMSMCILRHLETWRPLLVLKQSCTAAEGLQPVSKKDLLATVRHKHRVKTSQSYARVNIYVAVSLKKPINCWPPAVTKRWVEAACVAAPMPVPAMKVWTCNRLYKHWCIEKTHQINKHGRF